MEPLVAHARLYGEMKHKGQVRKYTGEPYFEHCEAVMNLVREFMHRHEELFPEDREAALAACLLHDTVEDTTATLEDIQELFGETVARYVYFLTKAPDCAGNRATRKSIYAAQLSFAPEVVRMIKFFDMYHNHLSIREHDPKFWELFKTETQKMFIAMNINDLYGGALHREYNEFWLALCE